MAKLKKDFGIKEFKLPLKALGVYYDNVAVSNTPIEKDVFLDPVRNDDALLDPAKARPILTATGLELYRLAARYAIYSELISFRQIQGIGKLNNLECGLTRIAEHILNGNAERLVINSGCDLSAFLKSHFPSTHAIWNYLDILKMHEGTQCVWNKKQADIDAGVLPK